jgi:HEAT repeat protein
MATGAEIDALFRATLEGDDESDQSWDAIHELRRIGSREVFEQASQWVRSDDKRLRRRGIDVLAQLGKTMEHRDTAFGTETLSIVLDTLGREQIPAIIESCIIALGHVGGPSNLARIHSFLTHPDPDVRLAVAVTLGSFSSEPEATQGLLKLMEDKDAHVRDWATFGLGKSDEPDSPEIREAFLARVRDKHRDAREEAIAGLCNRKDIRVLPHLIRALERRRVSRCVIESACDLLEVPAPAWNDDWNAGGLAASLRTRFADALQSNSTR